MAIALFFGGIVSGAIGGAIGTAKYNGIAGFFLGAFLGPIGWIIVLLLPADEEARASEALAMGTEKRCPACQSMIPLAATRCKHCTEAQPPLPNVEAFTGEVGSPAKPDYAGISLIVVLLFFIAIGFLALTLV